PRRGPGPPAAGTGRPLRSSAPRRPARRGRCRGGRCAPRPARRPRGGRRGAGSAGGGRVAWLLPVGEVGGAAEWPTLEQDPGRVARAAGGAAPTGLLRGGDVWEGSRKAPEPFGTRRAGRPRAPGPRT